MTEIVAGIVQEDDEDGPNEEEKLLALHRKEKKELQAKIQALKKTAPKGDKKKKKDAADEIAKLEAELEAKHEAELRRLKEAQMVNTLSDKLEEVVQVDKSREEAIKPTKAQKRRDKKADQAKERQRQIDEQDKANLMGKRHVETSSIRKILAERNLTFYDIPSDGNCMYAAILHQLNLRNPSSGTHQTVEQLRYSAAEFMRSHPDDFMPFMDDISSREKYCKYCDDVQRTTAWGGQLELRALSQVLRCPFEVVQAEGRPVLIGEEFIDSSSTSEMSGKDGRDVVGGSNNTILLTYHRHMFGLGEHYNSVQPRPIDEDEDDPKL